MSQYFLVLDPRHEMFLLFSEKKTFNNYYQCNFFLFLCLLFSFFHFFIILIKLVEVDKNCPQTWCVVGNCFSLQREPEVALKFFLRALQVIEKY